MVGADFDCFVIVFLLFSLVFTEHIFQVIIAYRGFRIDGPASSWPKGHEKTKSSWPSKNGFGHNSAGLSPILMSVCMVKDTIINKFFRAPGPHRADF